MPTPMPTRKQWASLYEVALHHKPISNPDSSRTTQSLARRGWIVFHDGEYHLTDEGARAIEWGNKTYLKDLHKERP